MVQIKEMLRRWNTGKGLRTIAAEIGVDRKTVGRYVQTAKSIGVARGQEATEEQLAEIARKVQGRPAREPSEQQAAIATKRDKLEKWLEGPKPLKLTKARELLQREGVSSTYPTLRRYARKALDWRKNNPTVRIDDPEAGQEAQVDFGQMGKLLDEKAGRLRILWVLVVTLVFSRHQFVWPTFHQTTAAVCEGLDAAWAFFGGMTRVVIPDNCKAMVVTPDELSAGLNDAFTEYLQARGIFADPARAGRPKDKPRVERQIRYVRDSWFAGEQFCGLVEARQSARQWCEQTAGMRIHGTTCSRPLETYRDKEHNCMLPAPSEAYDVPEWGKATVQRDCHARIGRALYSAPYHYINKEIRTRLDSTMVRIYHGNELIKLHHRQPIGGRATDPADYPPGKAQYARRSTTEALEQARQAGDHIGQYASRLLDGPLPWTRMRQVNALMSLCKRYGHGRVEAVCQSALGFDVVDVKRIGEMLARAAKVPTAQEQGSKVVPILQARFARSTEHFKTTRGRDGKAGT